MTNEQMKGYCILAFMVIGMKEPEIFEVLKLLDNLLIMVTPEEMGLFHKYINQLKKQESFINAVKKSIADGNISKITK